MPTKRFWDIIRSLPAKEAVLGPAYLAGMKKPPRDNRYLDPRPVTEEWLLSVGATEQTPYGYGTQYIYRDRLCFLFWPDGTKAFAMVGGGKIVANTVGEFQRLCDSLALDPHRKTHETQRHRRPGMTHAQDFSAIAKHAEEMANRPFVPRTYTEDRNCLSWWFPRIQGAGLPVPKTHIITTEVELIRMVDGESPPGIEAFLDALRDAANDVGYPAFLRTGHGSGKHEWERTCFVQRADDISQHVFNLVEWSECVDMMGLPYHVWAVRKYLPVRPLYRCTRYGNMPVVREWRAFVEDHYVAYVNPYWPREALKQGAPDCETWADSYDGDFAADPAITERIEWLASNAGHACGGRWSVDFIETDKGLYLTDMALAEHSWGYDESKFVIEDMTDPFLDQHSEQKRLIL